MSEKVTKLTLCLVLDNNRILLGYKKRGFGSGLWNGFGGKLDKNESIETAVHRELKEEADVTVKVIRMHGLIHFSFVDKPGEILEVHIYRGEGMIGEPAETEEMIPKWFDLKDIPYNSMWPDDIFWLPKLIAGKKFKGSFKFDTDGSISNHQLTDVGEL